MKIGIVLHPYGEEKPAGLARTIFELTRALIAEDTKNEYIIYFKYLPKVLPDFSGAQWKIVGLGGGFFWLTKLRFVEHADVYIFNTPVMPFFFRPRHSVILALDFAYVYFPPRGIRARITNTLTRWYHAHSLRACDGIVAISEATKKDVVQLFNIPEHKVHVVLCGYKKICMVPEQHISVPDKFFFFVGVIKERKNVLNIVRAFREFLRTRQDYALVLGGNGEGEYYQKILEFVRYQNIGDYVRFIGHLNDGQLSYVYKKAAALVFPSFVEGFGFPVLEAMDCGLPVITSSRSSLAELGAGGAALLVNPGDVQEITNAMSRIIEEPDLKKKLIEQGYARAQEFSWARSAKKFLKIIELYEM